MTSPEPAPDAPLAPARIDTVQVIVAATALWLVALAVTLLVPTLHRGERDWWPWTCVAGAALGLIGLAYVLRGRGNATSARRSD